MFKRTLMAIAVLAAAGIGPIAFGETVIPDFDAAVFTPGDPIDNPYFPLAPLTVFRYEAEIEEDGEVEQVVIEERVTSATKLIAGVQARIVRVREWIDGLLVEDTEDYYAQDTLGNVWYLGEFSTEFEYDDEDMLIGMSNAGSWQAGLNGALPGFIMPANPAVGFAYFQEHATADGALDEGLILSLTDMVSIDLGDFTDVLTVLETTQLEPGVFETKQYAPGIGLVLINEDTDELGNDPANSIPLVSVGSAVPEPTSAGLLAAGLAMAIGRMRRARADRDRGGESRSR